MCQIWQATFVSASRFAVEKKEDNTGFCGKLLPYMQTQKRDF